MVLFLFSKRIFFRKIISQRLESGLSTMKMFVKVTSSSRVNAVLKTASSEDPLIFN